MHPKTGDLRAFLDGELDGERTARVRHHLEECGACRRERDRLQEARELVAGAVPRLDRAPDLDAARERVRRKMASSSASRPRRPAFLRAAAVAVLFLGGISAALPGSPVREWLRGLGDDVPVPAEISRETPPSAPAVESTGGDPVVRIAPADGLVTVRIQDPAPGTPVRVRTAGEEGAGVSVAASAGFRSGAGYVEVLSPTDTVSVELPPGGPMVEIRWAERVLFRRRGATVEFPTLTPDERGDAFILTIPPG